MNAVKYTAPKWFNQSKSNLLYDPMNCSSYKIPFIKKDVNIKTSIYKTNILPTIKYKSNDIFNYKNAALKLFDNYQTNYIKNIGNQSKQKSLITKLNKSVDSLNTVTRVKNINLS